MLKSRCEAGMLAHSTSPSSRSQGLQPCCCWLVQVDAAAAGRAAVQRRAPPVTEAATVPGGPPLLAAVADDGNKVLVEAIPPLQVGYLPAHSSSSRGAGCQAGGTQGHSLHKASKAVTGAAVTHGCNLDTAAAPPRSCCDLCSLVNSAGSW